MGHVMKMAFLLSALLPGACVAMTEPDASAETRNARAEGTSVDVEFRVENTNDEQQQVFHSGETLTFVFEVRNRSSAPQRLAYTFPPHRVEVIDPHDGKPVWQAWEGRMFPQVMRHTELAPGESETFSVEWQTGAQLPGGQLHARATFHGFLRPAGQKLEADLPEIAITIE